MIEFQNVTKIYPGQTVKAVDDVSIVMETGEITVLVGPSGCGKSTTIRLINGMIDTTAGDVFVEGKNIKEMDPDKLRMGIGYVIQQIGLLPHRTIAQNIAIVPKLHGWDKERINKRTIDLLNIMGLDPDTTMNKYPLQLSGGQMQRVGVARAMAVNPSIMLMDEPFGAVDPITRRGLQDEFLKLQKNIKKTICFVTHDINEAIKMGDKIAIMNGGKIVQFDTPQNILSNPKDDFVKNFIGADRMVKKLNIFDAHHVMRIANDETIIPISLFDNAFETMKKANCDCAFIQKDNDIIGILTSEMEGKANADVGKAKELMELNNQASVSTCTPLNDVFSQMLEYNTECIPVKDDGKIVGMIKFSDIRNYICQKEGE